MIKMSVEIVGQQLRIRVRSPKGATAFGTQEVGENGRLQRVVGYYSDGWHTQSWRLNLSDYNSAESATRDLLGLYRTNQISKTKYDEGKKLIKRYYVR